MKNPRGVLSILAVCFSILLIALGCSDDNGGGTAPPPPDTTPPKIASVAAHDTLRIEVMFDEEVDQTTAESTDNYTIVKITSPAPPSPDGGKSSDDISLVEPDDTMDVNTVSRTSPTKVLLTLAENMGDNRYAIFVVGVKDLNGNEITTPDSTTFDGPPAAPPADTDPPKIASVEAKDTLKVEVTYDEAVDQTTSEDPNNYTITEIGPLPKLTPGDTLDVNTAAQISPTTIQLTLDDPMGENRYAIFVVGVEDTSGNAITTLDSTQFNGPPAVPPLSSPLITFVVSRNLRQIEVTFDVDVEKTTAEDGDNYTIREVAPAPARAPGDELDVNTVALISSKTVLITLLGVMGANPYTVSVTGVEDMAGNSNTTPDSRRFDGRTVQDQTPPDMLSVTPATGTNNVGIGESMTAQFTEPVTINSVVDAFSFVVSSNPAAVSVVPLAANIVRLTPVQPLSLGASCNARFSTAVEDWTGNNLTTEKFWSFSTTPAADGTPPTLSSTTPNDGATNVPVDVVFELVFSEAIDPASLGRRGHAHVYADQSARGEYVIYARSTLWSGA
jgi:hypothetical protein